jgi:hypothetical protein
VRGSLLAPARDYATQSRVTAKTLDSLALISGMVFDGTSI